MIKKIPFGAAKAALGCGTLLIFFAGIFGIVVSFFANDPALASMIRKRCFIGIGIGITMIVAWKIYQKYSE
jgi:hypothetical protein